MRSMILVLIVVLSATVFAQQSSLSPEMTAATALYNQKKFDESAKAFEAIAKTEPKNGRAWYFLGMSLHSLKRYTEAIAAFEKNVSIVGNPAAMYNIACGYSRLGQADKSFEWLERSIKGGPFQIFNLSTDPDLENIRQDPRFKKMEELADRVKRPCIYSAEARQFDFWVGEWDVFNLAGQKAGTSVIQSFANGCGVMENWTSTIGSDGKSINYYDSTTGKWYQSWIGSTGGALRYAGNYGDGAMRFLGETVAADGKKTLHKLTFFNVDASTVRQFAESSVDDGKTWTVTYDFKYVRRKQ